MKQNSSIAFLFLIFLAFSCQTSKKSADSGTKYWRHLKFSETPYDRFSGLHALTAEEASTVNSYKFTYNEEGKLVSVEYCRGNELLDGSQAGAPKITITWEGNKEIHHYFDRKGQPRERSGYFTAEYTLDGNGVRTGLRFLDRDGNPAENRNGIAWYNWKILANGQLRENRYNLKGEETVLNRFCPFYELRFSYDDKGFVRNMANYQGDTMYNCTEENCGDIGVSAFSFDYNDAGDLTQFTVRSLNGQLSNLYWGWARFENKVDADGNVIERASFDQDNEPLGGLSVPVIQSVYDAHGSLVERKFMDADRNLMNDPHSGIAVSKYVYNDAGQPVDTLNFNAEMVEI
jgi:hypothetical protein